MDAVIDEEEYQWSDDKCTEIANKHYFPSSVKHIDVQKGVVTDFFNFYLGGKCRNGLDVADVVFAVLSIVPATPKLDTDVWPSSEYKADGSLFYISPTEKLKANADTRTKATPDEVPSIEIINSPIGDTFKTKIDFTLDDVDADIRINKDDNVKPNATLENEQQEMNSLPLSIIWLTNTPYIGGVGFAKVLEYGPVENAAFINSVTTLLDRWSEPDGTARATLKYFFFVIALILLRSTTKGYKHLEYAFANDKFLYLIKFSNSDIKYSVPHKRCLKAAYRTFMRRDKNTPVMFAKIIKLYLSLPDKHKLKITIKNALLSHTSGYGFTLVNMWQVICNSVVDFQTIATLSRTEKTKESWRRLTHFFNKYLLQKTFYWARVINSKYFTELSCSQNYELAVILAVFVEKLTNNSNVWKATWIDGGDLENAKKSAHALYDTYISHKYSSRH